MKRRPDGKNPPASKRPGNNKKHLLAILLLFFLIFLAYSNSLHGTWAMDDVVANKPVGLHDLRDFAGFRKVAYLTFLLNQAVAPFRPANFRLFNIFIHFMNAVLIYALAYKTMLLRFENERGKERPGRGDQYSEITHKSAFFTALISSVVFGLHPININAVAYIVQRMASLATFFVLIALLFYVFAARSVSSPKAALLYVLSGACIVAGIFSKENAVMAIPLIILYDYVFLSDFRRGIFAKRASIIASVAIVTIGSATYFLRLYGPFIDLVRYFLNPNQPLANKGWMAVDVYWTPLQHILTEFRVVSRYIFLVFFPFPRFMVFDWWGFPVSTSLTAPVTTVLSAIFLLSLFVFSIWKIKRFPLLCFGILWYLISISLESFVALGSDLYFEHRNYLPVAGLFIGICGQIIISFPKIRKEKNVWSAAIVLSLLLASLTFSRNFVWKDSVTLWADTLQKSPSNLRAMVAIGNAYLRTADMDKAEQYFEVAMKVSDRDKRPHFFNDSAYSLGMTYLFMHKLGPAKTVIENFDKRVESYRPKILKGFYEALNNDFEGALRCYHEVLKVADGTDSIIVLTLIGDAYRQKGLYDDAISYYNKAITRDPSFSAAYYGIGESYLRKRNVDLAMDYFKRTLFLDPGNVLALSDMADVMLLKKSRPEDALIYAQMALSKSPSFYDPYLTMGNVLIVIGREKEADDFYKKALEHGMPDYMVPFGKARSYFIRGDREKVGYYLSELKKYKDLPGEMQDITRRK